MADTAKYYTMPLINVENQQYKKQLIPEAKYFLEHDLPNLLDNLANLAPQLLTQKLLLLCRNQEQYISSHAALCLRCFVSNIAKITVDKIAQQYEVILRKNHPDYQEILFRMYTSVLNDDGKLVNFILEENTQHLQFSLDLGKRILVFSDDGSQKFIHRPFSFEVLGTFALNRTNGRNLANWTALLTERHQEFKKILNEYGIYRQSIWSFLSKQTSEQIRTIEREFSNLTTQEIDLHVCLVDELRKIHRESRLKGEKLNQQQKLARLLEVLIQKNTPINSLEVLEDELHKIMKVFNNCRNAIEQADSLHHRSQDNQGIELIELIEEQISTNTLDSLERSAITQLSWAIGQSFQVLYKQQRLSLLDKSISSSIFNRITYLQTSRRSSLVQQSSQYLPALQYFFCSRLSMKEIASLVGLQSQTKITRLLKLSDLIADSKHQMLELLRNLFLDWVQQNADLEHQQILLEQPGLSISLLDEPIQDILNLFKEAQTELHNPHNQRNSLFSQRICIFVNHYNHERQGEKVGN